MSELYNLRSLQIHQNNRDAGWWNDLKTGECMLEKRNRPEVMMLMVSELSEASEGYEQGLNDDKLPHRAMSEVELADFVIRTHDLLGAENYKVYDFDIEYPKFENLSFDECLMKITNQVSFALEGYRKSNRAKYLYGLEAALFYCYRVAETFNYDIEGAIQEKLNFNKVRPDHKVENRVLADGKKI